VNFSITTSSTLLDALVEQVLRRMRAASSLRVAGVSFALMYSRAPTP
jgi:hypothetical protein